MWQPKKQNPGVEADRKSLIVAGLLVIGARATTKSNHSTFNVQNHICWQNVTSH
jgi:hypothetical protein